MKDEVLNSLIKLYKSQILTYCIMSGIHLIMVVSSVQNSLKHLN